MLYRYILLKDKQLYYAIKSSDIPPYEQLEEFLNSIILAVDYVLDTQYLDDLFILFRKWKTITNHFHKNIYHTSIDKYSSYYMKPEIRESLEDRLIQKLKKHFDSSQRIVYIYCYDPSSMWRGFKQEDYKKTSKEEFRKLSKTVTQKIDYASQIENLFNSAKSVTSQR